MSYEDLKKLGRHIETKQQKTKPSFISGYLQRKKQERQERREDEQITRAQEREAYKKAYAEGRVKRAALEGRQAGMQPRMTISRFILGPSQPQRPQKTVRYIYDTPRPRKKTKKRKTQTRKQSTYGFDIDPVDNWGFL